MCFYSEWLLRELSPAFSSAATKMKTKWKPHKLWKSLGICPRIIWVKTFRKVTTKPQHISSCYRRLCVGLGFISFVYSLHLASNILFAGRNSLSCIMFILLLIGPGVNCRWIAARIPVRVLGVSGWPFSDLTSAYNFRSNYFSSTGVTQLMSTFSFRLSHHFSNFLIPHEVALYVFSAWPFASNLS